MTPLIDKILKRMDKEKRALLSDAHIQTLRDFDAFNKTKVKESTRNQQLQNLMILARHFQKPFEEITRRDLETYIGHLCDINKPYTVEHKKVIFIKFWNWMEKPEIIAAYDKDIPVKALWSDAEVKKLIEAFTSVQHKALTANLYDTEARINELLSMDIEDVLVQGDCISIWLPESKTKKRNVGLIFSVPYLLDWLNQHPEKNNPKAPLWISQSSATYGKRLSDCSVNQILQTGQRRCGVDKHVHPHLLRHSMASKLRKAGFPDALHRKRMGLKPGSAVLERYTHLSDKEVHIAAQKAMGFKPKNAVEDGPNPLEIQTCFRCGTENTATAKYCSKCFTSLDYESVDRDLGILELFKSSFAKFEGVDVDNMLCEYKRFKAETKDMQMVFDCFNGGNTVANDIIKKALRLDDDDCINLLEYLCTAELIEMDGDMVVLLDRQKYQQFLTMQKRYLEINAV